MPHFRAADGTALFYTEAGTGPPVLALAGLTRNTGDFDHVAPHLPCRLIRMDYRGRGQSDRADPASYTVAQEAADAVVLLDHLGLDRAAVLGTSRGGLIAMTLAATHKSRLTGVALNDIGPEIAPEGLKVIEDYIGRNPDQTTHDEAARVRARTWGQFEGVDHARWLHEVRNHYAQTPDGLVIRYDPALRAAVFDNANVQPAPDLWPLYEALDGPAALPDPGCEFRPSCPCDLGQDARPAPRRHRRRGARPRPRAVPGRTGGGAGPATLDRHLMNIDMIRAAADRLAGNARHTPLLSSPFLDEIAGRRVLVKPECLQHTGSFKFRGGWAALSALDPAQRARGVIAYSSGNHAQGVAQAARMHGVRAVIVMPSDAPALKIANTRALGAEVVLYDRASESREDIGDGLAAAQGLTLIRPYDEAQVIAGQGTCGLEIAAAAKACGIDEAEVLVCCGGGGLTSGIALACAADHPGLTVRPVEPEGFDDVKRSLETGTIQSNDRRDGNICDAIVTPAPGALTFPIMARLCGARADGVGRRLPARHGSRLSAAETGGRTGRGRRAGRRPVPRRSLDRRHRHRHHHWRQRRRGHVHAALETLP